VVNPPFHGLLLLVARQLYEVLRCTVSSLPVAKTCGKKRASLVTTCHILHRSLLIKKSQPSNYMSYSPSKSLSTKSKQFSAGFKITTRTPVARLRVHTEGHRAGRASCSRAHVHEGPLRAHSNEALSSNLHTAHRGSRTQQHSNSHNRTHTASTRSFINRRHHFTEARDIIPQTTSAPSARARIEFSTANAQGTRTRLVGARTAE
jgi:hypothetical protein